MRRNDWASRMYGQFDAHAEREFRWGVNDCCLFVARVIDSMTDSDLANQLAQQYSDEVTALRFIESSGGLESAVSRYLGLAVEARATRGDAVMVHGGLDLAMGICAGPYVLVMGAKGMVQIARSEIRKVWKP